MYFMSGAPLTSLRSSPWTYYGNQRDVLSSNTSGGGPASNIISVGCMTGLHGADVAISGRRQPVLDSAVEALCSDGIKAIGIQVYHSFAA